MPRRVVAAWLARAALVSGGIMLFGVLAVGGWALGLQAGGNLHVVEPGALYRSAQLNGSDLQGVLDRYAIRTVLNLRGTNKGQSWYDDEIAVTAKRAVTHIDIAMSAMREPDEATLEKLVAALRTAPKPILVHCKDGADRSGLAAALYELLVVRRSADEAAGQLSLWFGHFPWLGSRTAAMDATLQRVAANPLALAPR